MTKEDLRERLTIFAVRIIKMVEEELDETSHWLDIIMRSQMIEVTRIQPLYQENKELLGIIVKTIISTKARMKADDEIK